MRVCGTSWSRWSIWSPKRIRSSRGFVSSSNLGTYATSYRYTTPTGRIPADPPAQDVERTANSIAATLLEVAGRFGVDLDAIDRPAGNISPIR